MRPDLFEQHTVHFHGYPNASAFYDGVRTLPWPSTSVAASPITTWRRMRAHISGTAILRSEHLQMGMVGQLYVRPRQNRVPATPPLCSLQAQQQDLRTACPLESDTVHSDILCSNPLPAVNTGATGAASMPTTMVTLDRIRCRVSPPDPRLRPQFPFCRMTFNPEQFTDMRTSIPAERAELPDTVTPGPLKTQSTDGANHFAQRCLNHQHSGRQKGAPAHLRLDVTEYQTLAH